MALLLDAGALIALERGERRMWLRLKAAWSAGMPPLTHGGVVAQVWRGGTARQVPLARALSGVHVAPLDAELGRVVGLLLGQAATSDVIDAALVALSSDDDQIVTTDVSDLQHLAGTWGRDVDVVGT